MKLEFALEDADLFNPGETSQDSEADIQGVIAGVDVALEDMAAVSKMAAILRSRNASHQGTRIGLIATEGIRKRLKIGHIKPLESAMESIATSQYLNASDVAMEGIGSFLASVWKSICDALAAIWRFLTGKSGESGASNAARDKEVDAVEEKVKETVKTQQAARSNPAATEQLNKKQTQTLEKITSSIKDQGIFKRLARAFRSEKAVISDVLADIKLSEGTLKSVAFMIEEIKIHNTRVTAALEAFISDASDEEGVERIKKMCEEFAQHIASHTKDIHDRGVLEAIKERGHDDQHYGEVGILPANRALLVYNEKAGQGEYLFVRVRPTVVNAVSDAREEYTPVPCTNPNELLALTDAVKHFKNNLNKLNSEFDANTAGIIKQQKNLRNRVDGLLEKGGSDHHPDQLRALHTVVAGALTYVEGTRQYLKAFDGAYKVYTEYLRIADEIGITL